MSGCPRVIDQGTRMLAHGGRMSLLGLPNGPVALDLTDQVIFKGARVIGVTGREIFRTWRQTSTLLAAAMVDAGAGHHPPVPAGAVRGSVRGDASGRSGKVILLPPTR